MGLSIFITVSTILAFVLLILSYLFSPKNIYAEKLSAYECGFEPFNEARRTFDIHFYIVAILFIIFDLEVAFLFP
jgi:NADH-quinone oxidoreductase subunit A